MTHTYDPQRLDVAEETTNVCQSWVLGNDEPLYVRGVRQTNDGGWHHSNWFFVPESAYAPSAAKEGPDATLEGTWNCSDRNFSEYLAAAAGGVFFAQSTQAMEELQKFPKGAALEIPPRSVIVGSTHLLNIAPAPLETALTMEVETVPREDVDIRLTPFSFAIGSLRIPPMVDGVPTESRTSLECDLSDAFKRHLNEDVVDYNVYYVLGHYHQWGNYFNLSFVHDDGTRDTIFEIKNTIGEPIGSIIDPPMSNNGATKLRSECGFINNTDETLTRGLQYGEMCDFLAYTDSNLKIGSGGSTNHPMGENEEGMPVFEVDCPNDGITGFKAYNDEF
ncbi:MAG: hypothetical protein AMJ63_13590 [Myxococcales bacterium SG8_38_1]|nr:MAG: hypothetical protein AMJ63_13590 [Myxococcales bacterium SG8_38_1]